MGQQEGKLYNKWRAYGQGKTANVLFATSLAKQLGGKGLTAVSLHPGAIGTSLGDHLDWNVEYSGLRKSMFRATIREGRNAYHRTADRDRGQGARQQRRLGGRLRLQNASTRSRDARLCCI